MPQDFITQAIQLGGAWNGLGWDTTKAAKGVRALTGVYMVSGRLQDYLNSFLYSLAMVAGIDVPTLDLGDKAAETAFCLADRWSGMSAVPAATEDAAALAEEEVEEPQFVWEQSQEDLPPDLMCILNKVAANERLDVKMLLENTPVWTGLKRKAEENNHRGDARSAGDKFLKQLQQRILNVLRVQAMLHTVLSQASEEVRSVSQQLWFYTATIEHELVLERKRRSIPGSVLVHDGVLFNQEDLKNQTMSMKLNGGSSNGMCVDFPYKVLWCFPTSTGGKGWKFKRWAPFRGGFSKKPTWRGGYGSQAGYGSWPSSYGSNVVAKGKGNKEPTNTFASIHFNVRNEMASCPPSQEVATLPPILEETCTLRGATFHKIWCLSRMGGPSKACITTKKTLKRRGRVGLQNHGRLSKIRSRKIGRLERDKILSALVCDLQTRRGWHKTSVDLRLPENQRTLTTTKISVGAPSNDFALFEEEPMGGKSGLERCILPPPGRKIT